VRGIVERSSSAEHLADSLRRVAGGEMQIGFAGTRENMPSRRRVSLTPREREIVGLLRQGLRNKQIAVEMGITEGTVKIYLFRLFHKLDVRNRFELAQCGATDEMPESPSRPASSSASAPRVSAAARKQAFSREAVRVI
jgi:DNA-binding NarL/FixJ family response regulator